jgi:predicted nuclease of restriction endonuclease-like (RecB) superfamily
MTSFPAYSNLVTRIKELVLQARSRIVKTINAELLVTYWTIGKLIVEKEKQSRFDDLSLRKMLIEISRELSRDLGKGFSRSQLVYMRLFYLRFPGLTVSNQTKKKQSPRTGLTVSDQLSWSHYIELLKCESDLELSFYIKSSIRENWSVRELRRQIDSALFERIALSKDGKGVKALAQKGRIIESPYDITRDPYVLEFLNIPVHIRYSEKALEQRIIDNLQNFILELGNGFAFIGRQYRITIDNTHYYIDLVFYHRILKCFVLIDLKVRGIKHADIGQMNLYLNYFATEQNQANDNPPVGIILVKRKGEILVEYTTTGLPNKIFVSKYQLYLPDKKVLRKKIEELFEDTKIKR